MLLRFILIKINENINCGVVCNIMFSQYNDRDYRKN